MTSACRLCPRRCAADRAAGGRGYCGAGAVPRVFRHGAHFGEEPPLSGRRGSGTVFFSHCTLRCIYCQNHPWSQGAAGEDCGVEGLRDMFAALAAQGCHNWNLVSPTPWLPAIRAAAAALPADTRLPFVYNTSGYEREETLAAYRDLIDIALPDLRYARPETAAAASDAADYVTVARKALAWFWREAGPLRTDAEGIAVGGTICRILVLPGHADEAVASLEWIAGNIGTGLHLSVMSQYTPAHLARHRPGWNRRVTADEYRQVTGAVERLGFANGWLQPFHGAETTAGLRGWEMPPGAGTVGGRKEQQ
jgi:putative pyruvate formate lyase activating enzyme